MSIKRAITRQLIAKVADEMQRHKEKFGNTDRRTRRKLARILAKQMVLDKQKEMETGNND